MKRLVWVVGLLGAIAAGRAEAAVGDGEGLVGRLTRAAGVSLDAAGMEAGGGLAEANDQTPHLAVSGATGHLVDVESLVAERNTLSSRIALLREKERAASARTALFSISGIAFGTGLVAGLVVALSGGWLSGVAGLFVAGIGALVALPFFIAGAIVASHSPRDVRGISAQRTELERIRDSLTLQISMQSAASESVPLMAPSR